MANQGKQIYDLAARLFPICRSITGNGVRQTLEILKQHIPQMKITEVPSGTKVFDWEVPREWNISEGYIENSSGEKVIDFKENNLHIMLLIWKNIKIKQSILYEDTSILPVRQAGFSKDINRLDVYSAASSG